MWRWIACTGVLLVLAAVALTGVVWMQPRASAEWKEFGCGTRSGPGAVTGSAAAGTRGAIQSAAWTQPTPWFPPVSLALRSNHRRKAGRGRDGHCRQARSGVLVGRAGRAIDCRCDAGSVRPAADDGTARTGCVDCGLGSTGPGDDAKAAHPRLRSGIGCVLMGLGSER
jgi:hypothetical protein